MAETVAWSVVFELQSGCDVALFWGDVGFMLGSLLGETCSVLVVDYV
jgi:hypothetical protein